MACLRILAKQQGTDEGLVEHGNDLTENLSCRQRFMPPGWVLRVVLSLGKKKGRAVSPPPPRLETVSPLRKWRVHRCHVISSPSAVLRLREKSLFRPKGEIYLRSLTSFGMTPRCPVRYRHSLLATKNNFNLQRFRCANSTSTVKLFQ